MSKHTRTHSHTHNYLVSETAELSSYSKSLSLPHGVGVRFTLGCSENYRWLLGSLSTDTYDKKHTLYAYEFAAHMCIFGLENR